MLNSNFILLQTFQNVSREMDRIIVVLKRKQQLNSIFVLFQIFQNVSRETERIIVVLKQRQQLNSIFVLFQKIRNVSREMERIIVVLKQQQKLGGNVKTGHRNSRTSTLVATVLPTSKLDYSTVFFLILIIISTICPSSTHQKQKKFLDRICHT